MDSRPKPVLEEADVVVLPGLAGQRRPRLETGEEVYPTDTVDVVKILRSQALRVEYMYPKEQRAFLGLFGADYWAPVLMIAQEAGASAVSDMIIEAIKSRIPRPDRTTLHLRVGRHRGLDGTDEWFEASGRTPDVLASFREWSNRSR